MTEKELLTKGVADLQKNWGFYFRGSGPVFQLEKKSSIREEIERIGKMITMTLTRLDKEIEKNPKDKDLEDLKKSLQETKEHFDLNRVSVEQREMPQVSKEERREIIAKLVEQSKKKPEEKTPSLPFNIIKRWRSSAIKKDEVTKKEDIESPKPGQGSK